MDLKYLPQRVSWWIIKQITILRGGIRVNCKTEKMKASFFSWALDGVVAHLREKELGKAVAILNHPKADRGPDPFIIGYAGEIIFEDSQAKKEETPKDDVQAP